MRVQSVTFTAAHKAQLIDGPVHAMQRLAASVGNLKRITGLDTSLRSNCIPSRCCEWANPGRGKPVVIMVLCGARWFSSRPATILLLFTEVDRENAWPSKVLTTERLVFVSDDYEIESMQGNDTASVQRGRQTECFTTERLIFFSDDLQMKSGQDNVGLHITVPC